MSNIQDALNLLNLHYQGFYAVSQFATATAHPVPTDSRGWSQILVSMLTGIAGRARAKGSDLIDGSDVKAANTWEAIDTPRFNGVIKAGTKASSAGKLASLDDMPFLFFVLWDNAPTTNQHRCRVWAVRCKTDPAFRAMCGSWYDKVDSGEIVSNNFQLHPPRGTDSNVFRNTCGNLEYPLLFHAEFVSGSYQLVHYDAAVLMTGVCVAT